MNVCVDMPVGPEILGEGRRAGADGFESAIARIERAVAGSCARQSEWPASVAAGLEAAIEVLIADPGAARALATDHRSGLPEHQAGYEQMIDRFARLLAQAAPPADRLPGSSDRSIVTVIAAVVSCHVRAGTIDSLADGDPDLVFLALLPYLGFAEASRWSAVLSGERPQV